MVACLAVASTAHVVRLLIDRLNVILAVYVGNKKFHSPILGFPDIHLFSILHNH